VRRPAVGLLLALGLAGVAWASAPTITVSGPAKPGGLLVIEAPPATRALEIDGASLPRGPDGRWRFGIERDATGPLRVEARLADGRTVSTAVALSPRSYRIQRLPALGTTDTPTPEWQARRTRELATIEAAKRAAAAEPAAAKGFAEGFRRPAQGRITGVYGSQRFYGGLPRNPHWGLDIAAPTGTPVVAPADGIVRLSAGPYLLEGNIVVLDHGAGIVTSYIHLDSRAVAPGQRVRRGDRLGTIGTTGRSTGPHLHWGLSLVRMDGERLVDTRLDPALLPPG
jgi:murein DD-endopeptidase MepM/ murein hydrolase activator NlpD